LTLHGEYIADVPVFFPQERYLLEHQGFVEGVIGTGDFAVTQRGTGANMSVDVAVGSGWIKVDTGTRNGLSHAWSDAIENVAVAAAHATLPRIDRVVVQYNDSAIPAGTGGDVPTVRVVTGTATSGATLDNETGAASVPADSLHLADVLVAANASSILTAAVRDRRPWAIHERVYTVSALSAASPLTIPVDSKNERLAIIDWELEFSGRPNLWVRPNNDGSAVYEWASNGLLHTQTTRTLVQDSQTATSNGLLLAASATTATTGFTIGSGTYRVPLRTSTSTKRISGGYGSTGNSVGSGNTSALGISVTGVYPGTSTVFSLAVFPDTGTMTGTVRVRRVKP
jgi:hypothetical protein